MSVDVIVRAKLTDADLAARRTLAWLFCIVVGSLVTLWLFSTYLSDQTRVAPWMVLGSAATAGAATGRMYWIAYFAFKTKTFDPFTIPHHYAWVVAGAGVTIAILAFPAQAGTLFSISAVHTIALAFALGVFSEDTWDALHGRVRAFLGKQARNAPTLPDVTGIDVPLNLVGPLVKGDAEKVKAAVAMLDARGIRYTHQVVGMDLNGELPRLAKGTDIDLALLRELARMGDDLRDPKKLAAALDAPEDPASAGSAQTVAAR